MWFGFGSATMGDTWHSQNFGDKWHVKSTLMCNKHTLSVILSPIGSKMQESHQTHVGIWVSDWTINKISSTISDLWSVSKLLERSMCLQAVHKDRACPLRCHLCRGKELVLQNPIVLEVCWKQVECCSQRILPCIIHWRLGWNQALLMLHGTCFLNKGQFPKVECGIQPFPEVVLVYQKKTGSNFCWAIETYRNQMPLEDKCHLNSQLAVQGPWQHSVAKNQWLLCESWDLRRLASWRFRWWVEGVANIAGW